VSKISFYIKVLLGHNSSRTKEIYTKVPTKHIQKIKSPIDLLSLVKRYIWKKTHFVFYSVVTNNKNLLNETIR